MTRAPDRRALSRRKLLASLGGAGTLVLAGCSGDGQSGDGEGDEQPAQTTTASPTAEQTETRTSTPTASETRTATPTATESVDTGALEEQISDLSFEGRLFDTHAHWAGASDAGHSPLDPETFAARMAENDVGGCTLFTSSVDAANEYPSVLQQLATSKVEYLPFLQPQSRSHLVDGEVTTVYENHETAFMGIGEIIFYGGPMQGTSLTADPWPKLFQFAAEKDIPLMIHPTQAQESGLKTMLSEHPEAIVMAHGGEFNLEPRTLVPLLENHDNLYWTIDAGSMLNGLVLTASDASEFVSRYDQQKGEFKELVRQVLPPLMDAAPDRVMWGTDLATDWNTDERVYSRIIDWTQAAIDSLPSDQQEPYAYKNATRLFGL